MIEHYDSATRFINFWDLQLTPKPPSDVLPILRAHLNNVSLTLTQRQAQLECLYRTLDSPAVRQIPQRSVSRTITRCLGTTLQVCCLSVHRIFVLCFCQQCDSSWRAIRSPYWAEFALVKVKLLFLTSHRVDCGGNPPSHAGWQPRKSPDPSDPGETLSNYRIMLGISGSRSQ